MLNSPGFYGIKKERVTFVSFERESGEKKDGEEFSGHLLQRLFCCCYRHRFLIYGLALFNFTNPLLLQKKGKKLVLYTT